MYEVGMLVKVKKGDTLFFFTRGPWQIKGNAHHSPRGQTWRQTTHRYINPYRCRAVIIVEERLSLRIYCLLKDTIKLIHSRNYFDFIHHPHTYHMRQPNEPNYPTTQQYMLLLLIMLPVPGPPKRVHFPGGEVFSSSLSIKTGNTPQEGSFSFSGTTKFLRHPRKKGKTTVDLP